MILPALYHWSPSVNRVPIQEGGLRLPTEVRDLTVTSRWAPGCACISLGPSPSAAWALSGNLQAASDCESWDVWQVRLVEGDEVHVRAEFGPAVKEVRVHNAIPADRVWWVGTR